MMALKKKINKTYIHWWHEQEIQNKVGEYNLTMCLFPSIIFKNDNQWLLSPVWDQVTIWYYLTPSNTVLHSKVQKITEDQILK